MEAQATWEVLLADREWLRAILDQSPAVISLKDTEGRYLLVNRRFEALFHVAREQVEGRTDHDLFPPEVADALQSRDREVLDVGAPREWEEVAPHDDGPHSYRSLKFPLFDASGAAQAVCDITTDITEREQSERSQSRRARLAALREDVHRALGAGDVSLRGILQGCAEALVRHQDAALARIWTFDEGAGVLEMQASAGLYTHIDGAHGRMPVGCFLIGEIGRDRSPRLSNEFPADPRIDDPAWADREGIVAFAGHPMLVEGRLVGVLALFARRPLDDDAAEALASVADTIAQGIARKWLEAERADLLARERAARTSAEANERSYRFLVKAIPQIVWTARPDGAIDYFNYRWSEYTGLSPDQSRGLGWQLALHPDDVPRHLDLWDRAQRTGEGYTLDLRLRRADGVHRWHLVRALSVRDRDGQVTKWLGTFTDIDDQKRAEGSLGFLAEASALLASSLDYRTTLASVARLAVPHVADWCAIDMVEADGSLRRLAVAHADPSKVSLAWELARRYPCEPGDPIGPSSVLRTGRSEVVPEISDAMLATVARDGQSLDILRRLGLISFICTPLVGRGRTLGVISLAMAESGRRYGPGDLPLAEELARRAALAVDNARLHQEAQAARREAEAASRAKDQFLAVLSHELRTPLTPVLATVSAMLDDPESHGDIRPTLEMVRRSVELEARLIDDLLDVTRVAHGKLHLNRAVVDAHDLLHQTLGICRSDLHGKRMRLEMDLGAGVHRVEADPARLQQILWNLVKNAVKFTPEGGVIAIRTRNEGPAGPGRRLVVEVTDSGIGIEPEFLPLIFEAFEQAGDAPSRQFGGLGLGLAISRSIAEAHGGRLTAASEGRGRGATFRLDLAAVDAPLGPDRPESEPPGQPSSRRILRILLVEDDQPSLRVMARLLQQRQYEVTTATTLTSALEAGEKGEFDLIISDIGLPDGNGLDLIRQLRALRPIRAIALSGFGMDEDLRRSEEAGFVAHLTKPVDFPRLEAMIQQAASTAS